MKNLIFIEGVSGVGKSAIATKLREALENRGYTVACHLEGDPDGPLDLCWVAYLTHVEYANLLLEYTEYAKDLIKNVIYDGEYVLLRYQVGRDNLYSQKLHDELHTREFCYNPVNTAPLSKFTEVFLNLWKKYLQSEELKQDFAIFDASLVSHMTSDMTRNYNASENEMVKHLVSLLQVVNSLNPIVFYLASDNVKNRLLAARKSRRQIPPTDEQLSFWEKRKQMDMRVLKRLPVESYILDISNGDWDSALDSILKRVTSKETDEERQARIYPIILSEYNPEWPKWFTEEKANLERIIGAENIARISHYGSTSVPGLLAKPTIDILLEINEGTDVEKLMATMPPSEYICLYGSSLTMPTPPPPLTIIKGYLTDGFAEKVYHIHVQYAGERPDQLYFRDYLIANPETAAEYAELKRRLFQNLEHDRDGYTEAKGEFVRRITKKAKEESNND